MLYELEGFRRSLGHTYTPSDVTLIVALRLHDKNPWVLERIESLRDYYAPAPSLVVVDFGSGPGYRERVEAACRVAGADLVRVEDEATFCLAKARNQGAIAARTALLFFSDIDCLGERDMFARLTHVANVMEFGSHFDQVLNLPVYHLGPEATGLIERTRELDARSLAVGRAMQASVLSAPGDVSEYVDPHSNFFLIRRDFFDYVGGINENFRGHGSEDFEFFLRVALYSMQYPLPERVADDLHSPREAHLTSERKYAGFRRLFELMSFPAQTAGLRIAHLHHPRGRDASGWYENNDWRRSRFAGQVMPLLASRTELLRYDWMPRDKTALVLIHQPAHADVFLPLRMSGYRLVPMRAEEEAELARANVEIGQGRYDAVAIFNPYMKSHNAFLPLFETARQSGVRTIVFERGALPESWYYGPDMSYADPDYAGLRLDALDLSQDELSLADEYVAKLRTGTATLENNGDYAATRERLKGLRERYDRVCLIPLQLGDDVAVTRFASGFPAYDEMLAELPNVAAEHPETLFLVKQHPLSGVPLAAGSSNLVICERLDNIHALIDTADAVIVYNSGVGLLALIHEKRLVSLGNAFYNVEGLGKRAGSLSEAVALAFGDVRGYFAHPVRNLVAWLVTRKYSFFRSRSHVQQLTNRSAHDYSRMLWYRLSFEGTTSMRRAALESPVAHRSYAATQLGIGADLARQAEHASLHDGPTHRGTGTRRTSPSAKFDKLLRDPKRFFSDSRSKTLRAVGALLPENAKDSELSQKVRSVLANLGALGRKP